MRAHKIAATAALFVLALIGRPVVKGPPPCVRNSELSDRAIRFWE